jgi:hypothetical protein
MPPRSSSEHSSGSAPINVAAEGVTEAIGGWYPQNAVELIEFTKHFPELFLALAAAVNTVAERLGSEFPVDPAVTEHLQEMAARLAGMQDLASETHGILITAHAEAIQKLQDAGPEGNFFDVARNLGWVFNGPGAERGVSGSGQQSVASTVGTSATGPSAAAGTERPAVTEKPDPNNPVNNTNVVRRQGANRGVQEVKILDEDAIAAMNTRAELMAKPLPPGQQLTVAELQYLSRLTSGLRMKGYARMRGDAATLSNIKDFAVGIYGVLGVTTQEAAVYKALSQELIPAPPPPNYDIILTEYELFVSWLAAVSFTGKQSAEFLKVPSVEGARRRAIERTQSTTLTEHIGKMFASGIWRTLPSVARVKK